MIARPIVPCIIEPGFSRKRTALLSSCREGETSGNIEGEIHWKRKVITAIARWHWVKYNSKRNAKARLLPLGRRRDFFHPPSPWFSLLFRSHVPSSPFYPSPSSVLLLFKWYSSSRIVPGYSPDVSARVYSLLLAGGNLFEAPPIFNRRLIQSINADWRSAPVYHTGVSTKSLYNFENLLQRQMKRQISGNYYRMRRIYLSFFRLI